MTPLFGPGWGNYALQGLVEIQLPDPVALVPQTTGWGLLLLVIACLALRRGWRRYRRWLRDRYRREALGLLDRIRSRAVAGDVSALRELAPTLRAAACSAAGRERVAGLTGDAWARALRDLAPGLPALPVDRIEALAYAPLGPEDLNGAEDLIAHLGRWMEGHEALDA